MMIFLKAHPDSSEEKIEKTGDNRFEIWVKEPPREGRANRAIQRALARHFQKPESNIRLARGFREKNKIFEIL